MSSVHWPILRTCLRRLKSPVIHDDLRTYTGGTLVGAALHLAAHLEGRCKSDTIATLLPTSGAFPIAALAGWMLGKTVVPLNFMLGPDEFDYVVQDCGTDTVVTVGPLLKLLRREVKGPALVKIDELAFKGVPELRWPPSADENDLAVLIYTSGTSGRPKGVMLTHGNLRGNVRQLASHVDFTTDDTMLGVLPQFHSFGLTALTLAPLSVGFPVVYAARFEPSKILELIRTHRPTIFVGIPSMYTALLRLKDASADDLASIRMAISGGEPLPEDVADRFQERFGRRISEGYGLTETSPVTNVCLPHEWRRGSVGRPLPELDQRIIDPESEREMPRGEQGEIVMAGPNVMKGYRGLPDESAAVITRDGFFRTGDIGRFDEAGHLHITGRIKEMLIVGGENVFPREIEEVLNRHPSVHASGVVGRSDAMRGEVPVAFVEVDENIEWDPQPLIRWCREQLAGYKVPREIHRIDELPRSPTGKILRRALKQEPAVRGA